MHARWERNFFDLDVSHGAQDKSKWLDWPNWSFPYKSERNGIGHFDIVGERLEIYKKKKEKTCHNETPYTHTCMYTIIKNERDTFLSEWTDDKVKVAVAFVASYRYEM